MIVPMLTEISFFSLTNVIISNKFQIKLLFVLFTLCEPEKEKIEGCFFRAGVVIVVLLYALFFGGCTRCFFFFFFQLNPNLYIQFRSGRPSELEEEAAFVWIISSHRMMISYIFD